METFESLREEEYDEDIVDAPLFESFDVSPKGGSNQVSELKLPGLESLLLPLAKESPKADSDKQIVPLDASFGTFKSADGSVVVFKWNAAYYSADGKNFVPLHVGGFAGEFGGPELLDREEGTVVDVINGEKEGRIVRNHGNLTYDGKTFKKVENPEKIEAAKMPEIRREEYMFKLPNGELLYVSNDKYQFAYGKMKMYVGKPGEMKEVPITDITRLKDGGTTYMQTPQGVLFVPSSLSVDQTGPSFGDTKLERVDSSGFEVKEDKNGVSIKKKK